MGINPSSIESSSRIVANIARSVQIEKSSRKPRAPAIEENNKMAVETANRMNWSHSTGPSSLNTVISLWLPMIGSEHVSPNMTSV